MSTSPPTLAITFKNNSNVAASAVYVGFVSGSSGAPVTIVNAGDNSPILAIGNVRSYPAQGNWYTLDALTSGVVVTSFSGRVYVCYEKPWAVQYAGYEPAQAVTDPNFYLRYDKMEMTFTGQPADVANLTSIDYWSIPLTLNTLNTRSVVQTVSGLLTDVTTQAVFDALNPLTTPPVSGVPGPGGTDGTPLPALVPGQFKQYGSGPAPGTTFARIIGPSSYPPVYPPPGAIPVTPYDLLQDYLTHLLDTYGPGTTGGGCPPALGAGVVAFISGEFAGVGPNVPPTGPQSRQSYDLNATIDANLNLTLTGTTSGTVSTVMVYKKEDLLNPAGIYGGNAPYYLNGSTTPTSPGNDVYSWIGGDLFAGLSIGAVGSPTSVGGQVVGNMPSQSWFKLPVSSFFGNLQPDGHFYNRWAATLSTLSQAYNFAYTDRYAPVFVSLNPANVDTLQVVLEAAAVKLCMGQEIITGICATRASPSVPDQTFIFKAVKENEALTITCSYGGGVDTGNRSTAVIPWGSTSPATLEQSAVNPAINALGSVQAWWSKDGKSYVVTFSGHMVRDNVNNIFSSDLDGAPSQAAQIIVAAYLAT